MTTRVLFVCLGNICRSPLAEGVFLHQVQARGLVARYEADSAGTSAYHAGEPADSRSIAVGQKNGVTVPSISRKVRAADYDDFDLIVAMDEQNLADLRAGCPPAHRAELVRMRDYDPRGAGDVPDPYYGGPRGFDDVYEMLWRSCEGLLAALEARG
ncbi:MAG: low molecular weight protein-tyrosine-phosphatase [Planctomycetota bacterium]